jgi:hypothetical protein
MMHLRLIKYTVVEGKSGYFAQKFGCSIQYKRYNGLSSRNISSSVYSVPLAYSGAYDL